MSILEAIVLAIVQGLTEFLPISSSGHLILARWLFGWDDPGLDFDVAVHVGTLAAILFAFRHEVWGALTGLKSDVGSVEGLKPRRLVWLGVIGTIPIVIVGGLFYETLQDELRDATSAGAFLLVTGALIAGAEWRVRRSSDTASLASLGRASFAGDWGGAMPGDPARNFAFRDVHGGGDGAGAFARRRRRGGPSGCRCRRWRGREFLRWQR